MRGLAHQGFALSLLVAAPTAAQAVEFNRDVRPILSDNCFHCHGPDASHRKAKMRLDQADSAYATRKGKTAVVPGHPERSELIARITAEDPKHRMPPPKAHKTLASEQIETLRRWIASGARYQAHWAYEPPRKRPLPEVADAAWRKNVADRWIRAGQEAAGVKPSPEADPVTLVRRVTFDLTGLPPTPEEVDAFVADKHPDAWSRLVDRLLASPRYGERMAIYWLDLVRYADTVGYHGDQEHPIAPYRDWVIDAFNDNMRFDRFTAEQLAGDLLPNPTEDQKIATGYNRVLQTTHEGGAQAKEYLAIYAADRVRNLSGAWLGSTLGCAQCHDHKFDPFTARDFYSMAAFFADIEERGDFPGSPNTTPTTRPPEMVLLPPKQRKELERIETELKTARAAARKDRRNQELKAKVARLDRKYKALAKQGRRTMITVAQEPRVTRILARGDWMDETGEVVQPAVPGFLPQIRTGGRRATRLDLARWLTSKDNPLTARVFVNRLWYMFFGRGLSSDVVDLGAQGQWPDHPELLDALALEFVRSGWDIKHMVRLIVSSRTYRQASVPRPADAARNPDNTLVAWQARWRLPAEMVRDNALSISGLLVEKVGGDSIKPYQPAGYYQHLNFPQRKYQMHTDERQWRRGVYMHWQRQFLHPALKAFDAPTREECTAARAVSNTPQAALTLLNDPTFVEAARVFAARMLRHTTGDDGGSDDARLAFGFLLATSRNPDDAELGPLRRLLDKHRKQYAQDKTAADGLLGTGLAPLPTDLDHTELAAWTSVARVLLNLHETTTRN